MAPKSNKNKQTNRTNRTNRFARWSIQSQCGRQLRRRRNSTANYNCDNDVDICSCCCCCCCAAITSAAAIAIPVNDFRSARIWRNGRQRPPVSSLATATWASTSRRRLHLFAWLVLVAVGRCGLSAFVGLSGWSLIRAQPNNAKFCGSDNVMAVPPAIRTNSNKSCTAAPVDHVNTAIGDRLSIDVAIWPTDRSQYSMLLIAYRLTIIDYRLLAAYFEMAIDYRLSTIHHWLITINYRLLAIEY